MEYEVIGISGLKTRDKGPNIDGMADELTEIYQMVARRGGRMVASHILTYHDATIHQEDRPKESVPNEVIFLVAEYPDGGS